MSEILKTIQQRFNFTDEQVKRLERYTDECLSKNLKLWDSKKKIPVDTRDPFETISLYCQCTPKGLREDYVSPEVFWEVVIYYKSGSKDTIYFSDLDKLDVFLGKIRDNDNCIELDSHQVIFPSAIAKLVFGVTERTDVTEFVTVVDK